MRRFHRIRAQMRLPAVIVPSPAAPRRLPNGRYAIATGSKRKPKVRTDV